MRYLVYILMFGFLVGCASIPKGASGEVKFEYEIEEYFDLEPVESEDLL